MTSTPRRLFLSFSATLRHLRDGTTVPSDFEGALFYFGCSRSHALVPWAKEAEMPFSDDLRNIFRKEDDTYDSEAALVAHRTLLKAIHTAEEDGRVIWRGEHLRCCYNDLNLLLTTNDFSALDIGRLRAPHYSYYDVALGVQEQGIPLTVVRD